MACVYFYKGHKFESELELDDFLIEQLPFEPILGDMVFSGSSLQNMVAATVTLIAKDSEEVRKMAKEARKNATYDDDGEVLIKKPPYIGVNKFLGEFKYEENGERKLLILEFRDEEYWQRRWADWKKGDFNEDERLLFNITSEKGPKVLTETDYKNKRALIENKWKNLAKAGDAIHNVLLLFFTLLSDGKYLFEKTDEEIKLFCLNNLDADNKDYISDPVIEKVIKHARTLHAEIKKKFGEHCIFHPEFTITLKTNTTNSDMLLGMIDLLVIDENGNPHIIDYKTSIHNYGDYRKEKRQAYNYLLAVYKRMLEKYGINVKEGNIIVAPIQIKGFRLDVNNKWIYDDIDDSRTLEFLNIPDHIWENIDRFLTEPFKINIVTEKALSTTLEVMSRWFPDFSNRLDNEAKVTEYLKSRGLLKKNKENKFVFNRFLDTPIIADNEVDFVKLVTAYFLKELPKQLRHTIKLRNLIKGALRSGINSVNLSTNTKDGSVNWLKDTISPYCNGNWEVDEESEQLLENFGLIMLRTKEGLPPLVDFIRVSTRNLADNYRRYKDNTLYQGRNYLTGTFETDLSAISKLNNLMLKSANGNVELMETMLVINLIKKLNATIGNILVISPTFGNGITASNEELLYSFNELYRLDTRKESTFINNFLNNSIKFATKYELVKQKVAHILESGSAREWSDEYRDFKFFVPATSILDRVIEGLDAVDTKIQNLQECLALLTGKNLGEDQRSLMQKDLDVTYKDLTHLKLKHIDLYNAILIAIAELKGYNFRQQLENHDLYFSDVMKTMQEGFSGNYADNPGNLRSETLNLATKLVTEAYQNTRDDLLREMTKVRKLVERLKRDSGMNKFVENTVGNQVSLYRDMIEEKNGDILFVNPDTLKIPAQKEFLEYVLYKINKDRFNRSDAQLLLMRDTNDVEYYRVPLCVGGLDSNMSEVGLLNTLKSKLEYLLPSKAWELAKMKAEGIFNAENNDRKNKSELLYRMTNMFDMGNSDKRLEKIKSLKDKNVPIEKNLETLLLKHMFAYSVLRNMNEVFPLIKASMIHILMLAANLNTEFEHDTKYLKEYIENKILNKTIVNPENEGWVKKANMLKKAASLMTLAVAPVLLFYLPLQGLWQDISLWLRKPENNDKAFTFTHFRNALKLVYSDLFHFSDKPTLCSAINELYGINDMDMNTYIERISSAKKGIWNLENFLFKFASRPDFYNRMTIFTTLMMGDGCLEAHSIKDGKLVYDWTKDKRFKAFAENPNGNSEEVNKARAYYYAVALLFVNEHAKDEDGNLFVLDMNNPRKLPRAYTNQLAESMKSLGDDIYGYYSHEKKSLIMSTAIGAMWLQFRTYWSGKKNQYLAPGGVKLRGSWQHLKLNDEYYYYQIDENGNILYNLPPLSESEMRAKNIPLNAPVIQWVGQWQEGILVTLSDLAKGMYNNKSIKKGWEEKMSVDPKLRLVYISNLKLLTYDFILWAIVGSSLGVILGGWLDELKKEHKKNRDFFVGLGISAANVAVMSVKNSFLDFNFFKSIGDPFGLVTPFSIEWAARLLKNIYNVAVGDEDFWDGVVKTSGGLKQIKPVLDAIKPDFWRTKQEGGTFGVHI